MPCWPSRKPTEKIPEEEFPPARATEALCQSSHGIPQDPESGSAAPAQPADCKSEMDNLLRSTRLPPVPIHNHPSRAIMGLLLAAKNASPSKGCRFLPGWPVSGSVTGTHVFPPSVVTRTLNVK